MVLFVAGHAPSHSPRSTGDPVIWCRCCAVAPTIGPVTYTANFSSTTAIAVGQSGTATFPMVVTPNNGFTGTVSFGVSPQPLPQGVWAAFSPQAAVTGGSGTVNLTLMTSATSVLGTYPITIQGSGGTISQSTTVNLTITTAASMVGPPPGAALTSSTATLSWVAPPGGAMGYSLRLGSTPGGSDYRAETLTTSQSMSVAVPSASQPGTMYATLGTNISGSWVSNTYRYRIGVPQPASGHMVMNRPDLPEPDYQYDPEVAWVLNDNQPREYDLCVAPCHDGYCSCEGTPGEANRVGYCRIPWDNNVTARISSRTSTDWFTVEYRATRAAAPGSREIRCTYDGEEHSVSGTLGVYDATPVISQVLQESSATRDFAITVNGDFFGRQGTLKLCSQDQQSECSASGITVTVTSWADQEIRATVSPSEGTTGNYDVQVTESTGVMGNPFAPRGSGSRPQSNRRGTVTVAGQPAITLVVKSDGQQINAGDTVNINPTPAMPTITAELTRNDGQPLTGSVEWDIEVKFAQTLRDGSTQLHTVSFLVGPRPFTTSADGVMQFTDAGSNVFGGDAKITWRYNGADQTAFEFKIRGQNPTTGQAGTYIASRSYWFLRNIAYHETNMSQFCEIGRTGGSSYCGSNTNRTGPTCLWPARRIMA